MRNPIPRVEEQKYLNKLEVEDYLGELWVELTINWYSSAGYFRSHKVEGILTEVTHVEVAPVTRGCRTTNDSHYLFTIDGLEYEAQQFTIRWNTDEAELTQES